MPRTYRITAEITRRAFMTLEGEDRDKARAMAEQLLEEESFKGWEQDLPKVMVEEIAEGVS
jgi:hypothetical protein